MAKNQNVSLSVVRRLPRYYRFLGELMQNGVHRISSRELADIMGLTASQIRQDLNCFGGFGQQGYGYNVETLFHEISRILGLDQKLNAILIGAGNLGRAIATHIAFDDRGFNLIGVFDKSPAVVGSTVGGTTVRSMDELAAFCKQEKPTIAVLCIPKDSAQALADQLVDLGIRGFWNFSHYDFAVTHKNVVVENVHMGDSLMTLSYCVHDMLGNEVETAL